MHLLEQIFKDNSINFIKTQDHYLVNDTIVKILYLKENSEFIDKDAKKTNLNFYNKNKKANRLVFFEDELIHKPKIITSMILGSQKRFSKKYRASKLELKDFKPSDYSDFFNKNHIDGYTPSTFGKGLFDGRELICGMIFRRPFSKYGGGWEIARYCTKLNTKVHGGASKIIKNWEEGLLVTYSNNRFSNGNVYEVLGFEPLESSKDQSYYYTDFTKRVYRTQCKKINKPEYKKYTEREQATMGLFAKRFNHTKPVYRVYDLGQKKWIYNKNIIESRKVSIYKFTDPKGKSYIGISYDAEHRFFQHICDKNGPLYNAIQKYGKDQMKFEIIYVAFGRQNAEYMEKKFIHQYNTYYGGYNRSLGGEGCNGGRKLDENKVKKLKQEFQTENYSFREFAEKYNVSETTIRGIEKGKIWYGVGGEAPKKKRKLKTKSSSLTAEQVKEIKTLLADNISRKEICEKFNIKISTVDSISSGRNWSHVEVPGFKPTINKKFSNTLNREKAEQIREEYKNGKQQVYLSKKYGVSRTTIKNIITYKTWK